MNAWSQMPGADKRGAGMISWAEGDGCGSSGSITPQITSLTIIAAKATSCVSTGYQSQNVLNNDASEWAVQVNNDKGLHKITLQLDQRAIVAGIAIHQGTRGRTFTRMHVCASGDHSTANEVKLPREHQVSELGSRNQLPATRLTYVSAKSTCTVPGAPQDFDMWNWEDTFLNLKTGTRAELPNVGNDEYPTE